MSSHEDKYTIKCWDDCRIEGCPSHKIQIKANNTSDTLLYYKDGEIMFGMDFDELDAFIKAVHKMRYWVEIDGTFKSLKEETPNE